MNGETRELLEDHLDELNRLYDHIGEWADKLTYMANAMDDYLSSIADLAERTERLLEYSGD